MDKERLELLKALKDAELERIELDFRGSQEVSREEYKKAYDKEMELREMLYRTNVNDITDEEIRDYLIGLRG